jgi:hypothetical protein
MNAHRTLERAAIKAHRRGIGWNDFWHRHADQVRQAEPFNVAAYHRLMRRLLSLVVSGDLDGQQPVGDDMPWERDVVTCNGLRIPWAGDTSSDFEANSTQSGTL